MKKSGFFVKTLFIVILLAVGSCGKGDSGGRQAGDLPEAGGVAGELIAVVSAKEGQAASAKVLKPGSSQWTKVKLGDRIMTGDQLTVEDQANAMIRLKTGEEIACNSGTMLKFISGSKIRLDQGELWINTSFSDDAERLSIKTKEGEVTIEGTIADLRYRDKVLRVSVVSGKARIVGERGEIEIHGGEEALFEPEAEPSLAPVRDPGMLAAWTEAIRREIRRTLGKEGEEEIELPRGLGTLSARVPGGKKDLPFNILSQEVTVKIRDQIALTKVEQVFQNPTKSTVEGTYKFPIPHGARMNRFDMEIKGRMMQGEIVERQRGRAIMAKVIKQFVDMMRDPALVEWESGSTFKTRIFPILGKQKKRIVLSYIQTLGGEGGKYRYVLPVATPGAAAPVIPEVKIHAEVTGTAGSPIINTPLYPAGVKAIDGKVEITFEAKDFSPVVDFVIDVDQEKRPEADMVTYGKKEKGDEEVKTLLQKLKAEGGEEGKWDYFLASMRPEFTAAAVKDRDLKHWIFLVDTSQSRTLVDAEVQKKLVEAVIGNLSREDRVKVVTFDAGARVMDGEWQVPSRHTVEDALAFIESLPPAGATNIEGALFEAARQLGGVRGARIVLIGDGAATLGENRPKELSTWAAELFNESRSTVTTVGIGSSIDHLLFEDIAVRTGGKFYYLSSGEDIVTSAVKIITSLRTPLLRDVEVSFEGLDVKDIYPKKISNIAGGQEIIVTGRYRGSGGLDVKLSGRINDEKVEKTYSFNVGEGRKANSFVPIIWASRKIDDLTLGGGKEIEKEIVKLSKKYSLPSRYTSFIVLESAAMYKEFNVQRDKDRIEWEGGEEIEYEEALVEGELDDLDEMAAGELDVSSAGIAKTLGASGGASVKTAQPGMGMKDEAKAVDSMKKGKKRSGPASKPAKAKGKVPVESLSPAPFYEYPPYHRHYTPKPKTTAAIRQMPLDINAAKKEKTIAELKEAVEKEPLLRLHRMKHIRYLMNVGEYEEAFKAAKEWYAMDGGNPKAMMTMGDLMRIKGDLFGALRCYSGVLDVSPEKTKLMEKLAAYFESRKMWDQAYPFRVSRNLVKPSDKKAAAARAIAAARVGRWDDAARAAGGLLTGDSAGEVKLKKGVKLSSSMRELLLKAAAAEKTPLLYELEETSPNTAKLIVELNWEKPVDLDLWVLGPKDDFLGGGGKKGNILVGESGGEGEVFIMKKPKKGKYRVQVVCADERGCGNMVGKVNVTAYGKSKTIKFVMEEGWGSDVAAIRVKTTYY